MNSFDNLQLQLNQLKSAFGFLDSRESEKQLADDFMKYAQSDDEDMSGEMPPPDKPKQISEEDMGDEDEGVASADEIEDILSTPDEEPAENLLSWNNFSIELSDEYSNKLQQEQGLSADDANAQSYYIRYKAPGQQTLAVKGRMFGFNEDEGQGLKPVGGFATEEEIKKDLSYMKKRWGGEESDSTSGMPVDQKENLLVTLDKLSPELEAFKKEKEEYLKKHPETQEPVEAEPEKKVPKETNEKLDKDIQEELNSLPSTPPAKAPKPTAPAPSSSKKTPAVPRPVGKVPAHILNIKMKRESRLKSLQNIKEV